MRLVIVLVIAASILTAALYDRRQRRRGARLRTSGDVANEAMHNRIDINTVPYEPARHAGQRDWATYRSRDRKPRGRG